ncbi:mRNA turnover and ribosome assembly protein [Coemansia thaxteri]|uniref:Ribosome assembly factor mrt4 n=1 Tax=Coemansia thaxteri TaxID=2663907 RepID=A0A9W8EJN6_9FUNG|nr:mRNA turnover and ribosome assembly protein [Coemansia thaxteri]KAJ2007066.1 mRNA turnover and ribosome assembly protein [Coemansia thaxteri]KAJ2471558.1 mRNA turnover and ribosome assembly protein [Coemansia sp. RSA 2322]KAJ2487516.1 mRNA turnover and ribosome assembly protein [Coemansia sp. RSA 2320]
MPKAKRAQVVTLSKTKSKGKDGKAKVIEGVREAVEKYNYVWVFSVNNMRNQYLKQVRKDFSTSRFFFGRNKVMAKALGNTPEDEIKEGLHQVSEALVGDVGLLCTNDSVEEVQAAMSSFSADDYARAGTIATYRVVVSAGEVLRGYDKEPFPNNMEPQLRELGMPTLLRQGKITIDSDYVICEEGDTLTPQQTQLLKHFWQKMAVFKIKLMAYWHSSSEYVKVCNDSDDEDEEDAGSDNEGEASDEDME